MNRLGSAFQYSEWWTPGMSWKAGTKAVHLLLLLWVLSRGGQKSRPYSLEAVYATRGGINILGLPIGGNLLLRRVDTFVRRDER